MPSSSICLKKRYRYEKCKWNELKIAGRLVPQPLPLQFAPSLLLLPLSSNWISLSAINNQIAFKQNKTPPLYRYISSTQKTPFCSAIAAPERTTLPLLLPSLLLLLHPNLYLLPHSESWVSETISATYCTEIHNPEKEIQSINRCLFPGFCKLRWFVYEDRLATVE